MSQRGLYNDPNCTGGPPLVLGAALGRRTFYLDENGWLRGVTYRARWKPGENIARCMVVKRTPTATPLDSAAFGASALDTSMANGGVFFGGDEPTPIRGFEFDPCDGLAADCGCGFYAYHDPNMANYATAGSGCRVQGVIEAYGRLILGPSGYRAEKARVVAVTLPDEDVAAAKRRHELEKYRDELRDAYESVKGTSLRPTFGWSALATAGALLGLFSSSVVHRAAAVAVAVSMAVTGWLTARYMRQMKHDLMVDLYNELTEVEDTITKVPKSYGDYFDKFRANYPDVAVYGSKQAMIEAHPVTSLAHLVEGAFGE